MTTTTKTFEDNVAATSGALDGQYLWSNPYNWATGAVPVNGGSVILNGSGVDDISALSLTSLTESGANNLFYVAGGSLTVGTVYATSGFEFYAGILGVSQPNNVTVGAIVGGGSIIGAVGGSFTDLSTVDPGEHYFAGYGGSVTLSAAPVASSILEYGVEYGASANTIALDNLPAGTYAAKLEGVDQGDVLELPGSSVISASFGTGSLSITTNLGTTTFSNVQYDGPVTSYTATHNASTGMELITFTGPDTFEDTISATSGALDGQYLWSNPYNWATGAVPVNGGSVILNGSGVDDISALSLTSLTESGANNLFYVAGGSLTVGTVYATSGFEFYAGILGVSQPDNVTVGAIVGGGSIIGAVGGSFTDLSTVDPGEHYFAGYGGSVTLSAAPVASSILEYGVEYGASANTIALDNLPAGTYAAKLEGVDQGDVLELPGSSVISASFGTGSLSITTNLGTTTFSNVQYDGPVTGYTATHNASTGMELITFTGPDTFEDNISATSGALDGQYLWSNPYNWATGAVPVNGGSVILNGSGVDDISALSLTSLTESGANNLFYVAGGSLTVGTVYATSGFEFYAGILGVSQPNNVTVGAIVGGGSIIGAVGGSFTDLSTVDPGEHYFAGYGGSVTLSAAPVASSILEYGVEYGASATTIALDNLPVGTYAAAIEGLAQGDVLELPGSSVISASFGTGSLSITTNLGTTTFSNVQYDDPVTGYTATHNASTGMEVITFTGPDTFEDNVVSTSGALDGQYLWSNPYNWATGAVPVNGGSVILNGSGVDDISALSLTSLTESGANNLFYVAGGSLTVGTVYATSGFEFYAGILGVSQPNNVTVGAIVGGGSIIGAVGGSFTDLSTVDPGEHYFAGYGGSVTLSAAPVASSILEYGGGYADTIALNNLPAGTYAAKLEGVDQGDVLELPGSSVISASFGTGSLSITTNLGTTTFSNVQYDGPVTSYTATHNASTGMELITFTGPDTFEDTISATSGALDGQYLWSNPYNWATGAVPVNGGSVILNGSGVDDISALSLTSLTESGANNLFYVAGGSLTVGTVYATSGFEFYAGILGVSQPDNVTVGAIVGGGSIIGAVGGSFTDLSTVDPGEHYFAGYGGSVTLSAAPVASSILEYGVEYGASANTIALDNLPAGTYAAKLEGVDQGDVLELPGSSVISASFGTGSLSITTNLGTTTFTDVAYESAAAKPTGFLASVDPTTGLEKITFTGQTEIIVPFGVTSSGLTISSGSFEDVLSGGTAQATLVMSGGTLTLNPGAETISVTVASGGLVQAVGDRVASSSTSVAGPVSVTSVIGGLTLSSGAVVELVSATILGGGVDRVLSGGEALATIVSSGGVETVLSGGLASGTTVLSGGDELLSAGGVDSAVTVSSGGALTLEGVKISAVTSSAGAETATTVISGATLSSGAILDFAGATVLSGGILKVGNEGLATGTVDSSGGKTSVTSGGVESGAVILGGGNEFVQAGGLSVSATVSSGGALYAQAGGLASATTVLGGASLLTQSGGVVSGTQVKVGGYDAVQSGGLSVSATLSGGGIYVLSGATASATTLLVSGAVENVSAGGVAIGTVVDSGASVSLLGTGLGTVINAGASVAVRSGGVDSGLLVQGSAGYEAILSGGATKGATVSSGGRIYVETGGSLSGAVMSSGGHTYVQSGGVESGAVALNGGVDVVSGGIGVGATVSSGGFQYAQAGGTISGTLLLSGGSVVVQGGIASGTTVMKGGYDAIIGGGVAHGDVASGGAIYAQSGGLTVGAILSSGGAENVSSAGVASGTVVLSGASLSDLGTVKAAVVSSGGTMAVKAGGTDSGSVILGAGYEIVQSGGIATVDILSAGGGQYVQSAGIVSGTLVSSGGGLVVQSSGLARSAVVYSGGKETVSSGGTASAAVVSGGTLTVLSGGALSGGLIIEAGSAVISGTAAAGQTISFSSATGDLVLANLSGFGAKIAGMTGTGQEVDLVGFAYSSATESATWSQGAGSGTLTVHDGAQVATLSLIGTYVTSNFVLSTDGHGGTFVVDPPVTHHIGGFIQAMAVMGAGGHGLSNEGSSLLSSGGGAFTSALIPTGGVSAAAFG